MLIVFILPTLLHFGTLCHAAIDITLSDHIIKSKITDHLWVNFKAIFDSSLYHVHSTCYVLAKDAPHSLAIHLFNIFSYLIYIQLDCIVI